MDAKLFGRLVESMMQMNEIVKGERSPSREFIVDAANDPKHVLMALHPHNKKSHPGTRAK